MIVVTLFGTTSGLEVKKLSAGDNPAVSINDQWIALSEQVVKLRVDHDLIRFDNVTAAVEWAYATKVDAKLDHPNNAESGQMGALKKENEILRGEFEKLRSRVTEQSSIYGKNRSSKKNGPIERISGFSFQKLATLTVDLCSDDADVHVYLALARRAFQEQGL